MAANIRTHAEKSLVKPGQTYRGLVEFLKEDVMKWRQDLAAEEGIELA